MLSLLALRFFPHLRITSQGWGGKEPIRHSGAISSCSRAHGPSCVMETSFSCLFPSLRGPCRRSPLLHLKSCLPLSPSQAQALDFYYPIRDHWGAFFTAHWSVQCPCPDCNLTLGRRAQRQNTQQHSTQDQSQRTRAPAYILAHTSWGGRVARL